MPKSKYPQQLDTSVEIPPVRDNVLEVGSDAINSIRSAIFNIEKVLGINPQGAVGNTLSERINKSLDGNGNIRTEAIDRTNILSGPIIDADVSRVASIRESKLRLDYPTTLLQDEISILNSSIEILINQAEELSVTLSAHINSSSTNRHPASSISVSSHVVAPSDTALANLPSGSSQSTFEVVVDSHIGYSGVNIASDNNSHIAGQIYFDNDNVSAIISSVDMQNAMEEVANSALNSKIDHQNLHHTNGILNVGEIDSSLNSGLGNILAEDISISFDISLGNSSGISTVTINDILPVGDFNLSKSDILNISDLSDSSFLYSGSYEIDSFSIISGNLVSIDVYGLFFADSTSITLGTISKNIRATTNQVSLLSSVREEALLSSARTVQICNPNSVKVISSGIRPLEITTSNRFLGISLDSGTSGSIDLYSGGLVTQSIDSIVSRINEQSAENASNFFAYRVDYSNKSSEVAISHNLPDEDSETHTITLSRSSDSGIDACGFSSIEDKVISSEYGSAYYINGSNYEGLSVKLDSTGLIFLSTTLIVGSSSSGLDLISLGLKSGDLLVISDSVNASDDGSYVIESVTSTQLILSSDQLPSGFSGASQDSTRFRVHSNIVSFDSVIFDKVSSTFGSILSDIFVSSDRNVFSSKRFEYSASILGSSSLAILVDFRGDISDKAFNLQISSDINSVSISLDSGDSVDVRGNNSYVWVKSGLENVSLKFMIPSVSDLITKITSSGTDISINLFGFGGVNLDSNLLISRVAFNNFNGRIDGGVGSPRIRSILSRGNIGIKDISSEAIGFMVESPLNELRSNGVVYGLEIINETTTSGLYTFDITNGYCYIKGRKISIDTISVIISDIDSSVIDKIFIAIDEDGIIRVEASTSDCKSPFESSEVCILSSLEFDGSVINNIDLRLFINDLDLKILNSITVSNQPGMAHFTSVGKALRYAKRFSEVFPKAGVPTVQMKSGEYNIYVDHPTTVALASNDSAALTSEYNDGIWINFPVRLIGEGDSTVLNLFNTFTDNRTPSQADKNNSGIYRGRILIPGSGLTTLPSGDSSVFSDGFITLKDFRMRNSRILVLDPATDDPNTGNKLNFGITVDSVTFDGTEDLNFSSNNIGIRMEQVDVTNGTDVGNITISNCQFLNSHISFVQRASDWRNINITNNTSRGDASNSSGGTDNYLVRVEGSGHIFDLSGSPSESNINFFGNIIADNALPNSDASGPKIDPDGNIPWGDRLSRGLTVGSDISGENYKYNNSKTRTRLYTMDEFNKGTSGSGYAFSTFGDSPLYRERALNSQDLSNLIWGVAELETGQTLRLRVEDLHPGEVITGLTLGVQQDPSELVTWTGSILTGSTGGGSSTQDMLTASEVGTSSPTAGSSNIKTINLISNTSGTTSFSVSGSGGALFFVTITHNLASNLDVYWIRLTIQTNDVESTLGF